MGRDAHQLVPTNTATNRIACSDRCLPKQSGKIIFQTLASWFFRNKTLYACKHGWQIAKHFPILSLFYNSSGPVGCSDPLSRALPVSQRRHAESIPTLRASRSSSIPSSYATCITLNKLSPEQRKRKHNERRKSTARSYEQEPWL